jgi:hypothetical protein
MNVLFRDDDVMFHLVGFSKVSIRVFIFWAILWFQKVGKTFQFFHSLFFKFTLQEQKNSNVFIATVQKFAPKKWSVLTTNAWAMTGCDILPPIATL